MQHLSKKPRPEYLKAQTECTCTSGDKAQVSDLRREEELCSFPPCGGRLGWGGTVRHRTYPTLHPHPSPPPSRGRGFTGPLAVPSRVCFLQSQTQGECSHANEDTRPGSDNVTRTHTNHGWEP